VCSINTDCNVEVQTGYEEPVVPKPNPDILRYLWATEDDDPRSAPLLIDEVPLSVLVSDELPSEIILPPWRTTMTVQQFFGKLNYKCIVDKVPLVDKIPFYQEISGGLCRAISKSIHKKLESQMVEYSMFGNYSNTYGETPINGRGKSDSEDYEEQAKRGLSKCFSGTSNHVRNLLNERKDFYVWVLEILPGVNLEDDDSRPPEHRSVKLLHNDRRAEVILHRAPCHRTGKYESTFFAVVRRFEDVRYRNALQAFRSSFDLPLSEVLKSSAERFNRFKSINTTEEASKEGGEWYIAMALHQASHFKSGDIRDFRHEGVTVSRVTSSVTH
jgi:hypothetical protein